MTDCVFVALLWVLVFSGGKVLGDCPTSSLPTVANSVHDGTGPYTGGQVVTFTCNDGYTLHFRGAFIPTTCSSDGTFTGSPLSCVVDQMDAAMTGGCEMSGICCSGTSNYCSGSAGCHCDEACLSYNDCCGDYLDYCHGVCPSSGLQTVGHSVHNGDGSYLDGEVVTYTCNANYILQVGSQNTQTCSSESTFSGTSPVCLRVCSPSALPSVGHSVHNGDGSYMDGDVVAYTCNANYILQVGSENAQTCSSDGTFSGTSPVCLRVCSSSGLPTVGHSVHNGDGSYMDGDVVAYTCNANYILQVGSQNKQTCSPDGTFSGTSPVCLRVCSSSGLPTVGHSVHNGDGSYMDGDVVAYTCNANYILQVGSQNTQTCSSDGTFSGTSPVCLRVCSSSGLPTVGHSVHNGDGSYMDGDVVAYTCNANYILQVGSQNTQTCSSDGTFSGTSPVCLRVCSPSALPSVGHSVHNGDGSYMDGDVVAYTCNANYILQVGSENAQTCSSDGTFSGTSPVCLRVCSPSALPSVGHSVHNGDGSYMDGDVVAYTCNANYILQVGSENAQTCSSDGTFSGTSPVCLRVCSSSGLPTVGHSVHNGDGTYMDGEVVAYTCNANYILQVGSQNTQMCSPDGTFSGTSPVCLRVCSPSGLSTVEHSVHNGDDSYMDGDVVTYTCNANYILQVGSQNTQTCSADGTFSGTSPVCLRVCSPSGLPTVVHSIHNGDGSYMDGDVVTYTCNANYILQVGSQNAQMCSSDGTFSGTSPVCLRVCSPSGLPTVGHSVHNGDGSYMDGDVVTYTCHANYILQIGSQNTRTCSSDGTFSGTSPVCLRICPSSALPAVDGSSHDGDGSYMDGDTVTFTCDVDYLLYYTSPSSVSCQSDGTFSTPSPVCFRTVYTECFPNATIVVENPDPATYVSAHASDTTSACITVWRSFNSIAKYHLEITGCNKDSTVIVSFSSRVEDGDQIQGGANLLSYRIQCDEIAATGVARTVTQGLAPELFTAIEDAVSPTFTVTSALRTTSATGTPQSAATVGDQLYWTLDIPDEYTALPVSCTAYAGTTTSGSPTQLMVTDGCTTDEYLLDSFSDTNVVTSVSHTMRYYTRVWAFKFQGDANVLFHCTIKFCPVGSTACNINCAGRRKRADVAETGVLYGSTSRVLTVNEALESQGSEAPSHHHGGLSTCGVILAVWLLKLVFA